MHKIDGRARRKYRWIFVDKEVNIKVMTKPRYINGEVLVPRPIKKAALGKSFFIGRVALDTAENTTDVSIKRNDNIKQPHLDNSKVKDTEWKTLKDIY